MVGHNHKQWYFGVWIMYRCIIDAFRYIPPQPVQLHGAVVYVAEKTFHVCRAHGNEIGAAVVTVPRGACRGYAVTMLESVGGHVVWVSMLRCKNAARKRDVCFARGVLRVYNDKWLHNRH